MNPYKTENRQMEERARSVMRLIIKTTLIERPYNNANGIIII